MDLKVQSTLGLEPSDIEKLKQVAGVEVVQLGYSADVFSVTAGGSQRYSYDPGNNLNQYVLTEGRMPGRGKSSSMRERGNEFKLGIQSPLPIRTRKRTCGKRLIT